jgi:hypothetical protein
MYPKGTVVVSCNCEESIRAERESRQQRINFVRLQTPDLSSRKKSNYTKE